MEGWVNKSWTQRAVWGFLSYSFSSALYLSLYRSLSLFIKRPPSARVRCLEDLSACLQAAHMTSTPQEANWKQTKPGKRAECCMWITEGVNILRARLCRVLRLLEAHIKLMTFATGSECAGRSLGFRGLPKPRLYQTLVSYITNWQYSIVII